MANKKIWELPSWTPSGNTSNNTIPIDNNFVTQKISLSAITEYVQNSIVGKYSEITYSELYSLYTGGTLIPGSYYLITDYQTCYDQPNFNNVGDPIIDNNYKTGVIEPLLVFTTSVNTLSPQAYSTQYPLDKITYDINFTTTEVTSNPAKGRITERIDDKNNRADYDFRAAQFIRYEGFFSEQLLEGRITIDPTGLVIGFTTFFNSDFVVGDILGVYSNFNQPPIGSFWYFEITSITSDTEMYVTGTTIPTISDTYYSRGISLPKHMSPYQCNVTSPTYTGFSEYYTFNNDNNLNTYLGNFSNYNTFLLSNNVFLSGTYRDNYFGGGVEGNTFNDDMDSNICGSNFKYNIITNDFDDNTVGTDFQRNIIDCDMDGNLIGERFQDNMIGDNDAFDFDYNRIGANFSSNFITMSQDGFVNNNIGSNFYNNIVDTGFENNQLVGGFYDNLLDTNNFTNNIIGESFFGNKVYSDFYENNIGNYFYNNIVFYTFRKNSILNGFEGNTIGDIDNTSFIFENNQIMNIFKGNNIQGDFWSNQIKTNFKSNETLAEFGYNNIGFGFFANNMSGLTISNNIGDYFESNNCYGSFSYNTIGTNFLSNEIQDGFGFGGGTYRGNMIGNNFNDNNIGEYFYDNTIGDNFTNNIVVDNFQMNRVCNNVNSNDFSTATHVYGYYNCEIFTRAGGGQRLSYYDSSDVINITDITT